MGYAIVTLFGIFLGSGGIYYVAYRIYDDCRGQLAELQNDLHVPFLVREALERSDVLHEKKGRADTVAGYALWAAIISFMLCGALSLFYIWWN